METWREKRQEEKRSSASGDGKWTTAFSPNTRFLFAVLSN
jgi:hypothetical protein